MYTVRQAKRNLSRVLKEAEARGEVIIARGKTPVAKLVAVASIAKNRTPGKYKHLIKIDPSFYKPMTKAELKDWAIE